MVKILTIKKITIPKRIRELVWKKNIGKNGVVNVIFLGVITNLVLCQRGT